MRDIIHLFISSPPQPPAIENIRSDNPILFDVAGDNHGNIHVIWCSDGQVPTYQNSTDKGKTWSSIKSFEALRFIAGSQIYIRSIDNQVILFWMDGISIKRLASSDNGYSWDNPRKVISVDSKYTNYNRSSKTQSIQNVQFSIAPKKIISVMVTDSGISLIFEALNGAGTYFTRSDDYGCNWSRPIKLFPNEVCNDTAPVLAAAADDNDAYIIYQNSQAADTAYAGSCFMQTTNSGGNWNHGNISHYSLSNLKSERDILNLIGLPKVAVNDQAVHLIFLDDVIVYKTSEDKGRNWSKPIPISITDKNPARYSLFVDNSGKVYIPFISYKNSEKDWWGYLFGQYGDLISIDREGPEWGNNDLYYLLINNNTVVDTARLTHQLSYALGSIKCISAGDKSMIFWAGRSKVNKYPLKKDITMRLHPFRIFFQKL